MMRRMMQRSYRSASGNPGMQRVPGRSGRAPA
jgi:hypothetical protein